MTLPFFTPEPPEIGRPFGVVIDARKRELVASSTDPSHPIPACIVRSGTAEHAESHLKRIFP